LVDFLSQPPKPTIFVEAIMSYMELYEAWEKRMSLVNRLERKIKDLAQEVGK